MIAFDTTADDAGDRLDRVVQRHLGGGVTRAQARALVEGGRVRVGGRVVRRSSEKLTRPGRVEIEAEPADLERASRERTRRVGLDASRILFEDDALVAVDKPAGIPSHATRDPRRDHLVAAVGRLLEDREGSPPPELRLVHRLDAETSGVILLSRSRAAHRALARAFADRRVQKTYVALVDAGTHALPREWTVESNLRWDRRAGRVRSVRAGGDPAHTDFRLLAHRDDLAQIEARPHTGRTHQIRVHLAEGGTPIVGDRIYGAYTVRRGYGRLLLHSKRIELLHPLTGAPVQIESPLPRELLLHFS